MSTGRRPRSPSIWWHPGVPRGRVTGDPGRGAPPTWQVGGHSDVRRGQRTGLAECSHTLVWSKLTEKHPELEGTFPYSGPQVNLRPNRLPRKRYLTGWFDGLSEAF